MVADSANVFSLLGDETRLEILAILSESQSSVVSFSTLYEHVGMEDSGQFNYHLSQLVPKFVAKTDEGYRLTSAGRRIARAVEAGYYTESAVIDPFDIEGVCLFCEQRALQASYTDEQFHIGCTACDESILDVFAPPSLVRGRTPAQALAAFERWSNGRVQQAHRHELCPYCGGPIERTLRTDLEKDRYDVLPAFECKVCTGTVTTSFGALAVADPVVEAFERSRDVQDRNRNYWEREQFVTEHHTTILSEEPWRVEVAFPATEEICRVVIDDQHRIVRTELETRDGQSP